MHRDWQRRMRCPSIPASDWEGDPVHLGTPDRNVAEGLDCCPGAYARAPAAVEAERARVWWAKSQLEVLYPLGVPAVIVDAVEKAESERLEWEAEGARLRRLEADKANR